MQQINMDRMDNVYNVKHILDLNFVSSNLQRLLGQLTDICNSQIIERKNWPHSLSTGEIYIM